MPIVVDDRTKQATIRPWSTTLKWGQWLVKVDGVEGELTAEQARALARHLGHAASVAERRTANGLCQQCTREGCRRLHDGAIVNRYGHGPEYRIEGTTKGKRVRLRNMDTGKLKYTRSLFSYQFVRLGPEKT